MSKKSDILNKLRYESENTNEVHLWLEGMFWKAYERSAYLFVRRISGYKPYKKYVRSVGGEVVAIGFPSKSIGKLLEGRSVEYVDEKHYILNGFTVDAQELRNFQVWKKGISSFPYHVADAGEGKIVTLQEREGENGSKSRVQEKTEVSPDGAGMEKEIAGIRKRNRHLPEGGFSTQQEEYRMLGEELRRFRMESSTPLECMMFLAHLIKKSLETENK